MKKPQRITTLLLCSLLLIAFSTQVILHLSQIDPNTWIFTSSGDKEVDPLRKEIPKPNNPSEYGIIPLSDNLRSPYARIVNHQQEYFPEASIRVKNRFQPFEFNGTDLEGYALVQQTIKLFLSKNGTRPDPLNTTLHSSWINDHWIISNTTNGTPKFPGGPAISDNPDYGVLDVIFQIPDITTLKDQYNIVPGDLVEIYQFYPSGNITSQMQGLDPFGFSDTFNLSAYASISPTGIITQGTDGTEGPVSRFRQGDNGSTILNARWGTNNIPNVEVGVTLHNATDNTVIANGSLGFAFNLYNVTTGINSKYTDNNGNLKLSLNTAYPTTPLGSYYFNVTGDFTGTGYNTSHPSNISFVYVNFIIANDLDTATIELISARGYTTNKDIDDTASGSLDPPNENITIVTFRVTATNYYTGEDYYPAGIPVNITLDNFPYGVTLSIVSGFPNNGSSGWFITNTSGYITCNITANFPPVFQDKIVNIAAVANFQNNIAPSYPMARIHRFMQSNNPINRKNASASHLISIDPDFWVGDVQIIEINTTDIRPGESVRLVFEVFSSQSEPGTIFKKVPVNITLNPSISGVTITVINPDPYIPGYYYFTNASGMIEVEISTDIGTTPAAVQDVIFEVTVDFENDSNWRWIGTQHSGFNTPAEFDKTWHKELFSDNLDIDPQYFIGEIFIPGGSPNATRIQQNETIQFEFGVRLRFSKDNVLVDPADIINGINGINISILINGSATSADLLSIHAMEVVEGSLSQNTSFSSVIFTIKTNISGETIEADYNITTIADFGAAQSLIYNFTHPTVSGNVLPGKWVNGTDSLNQISKVTDFFTVKNVDRIITRIESIVDSTHSDAGKSGEYWEVYRGTTSITINGTYKDRDQAPKDFRDLTISINYTEGASITTADITTTTTDLNGFFQVTFSLSTSLPLKDIAIFARDTDTPAPDPQEDRVGIEKVRLVSEINLNNVRSGVKGNALYVGQTISMSGQLTDDQNVVISNTTEFSNRLSLLGWNNITMAPEGVTDTTGIDGNGNYILTYQVPGGFTGDWLYINLSVTAGPNLLHYRPILVSNLYNIYRDFKIDPLYLNNGTDSFQVSNGGTYWIKGVNFRNIIISGIIRDLTDHPLNYKTIRHIWNLNQNTIDVNSSGGFLLGYQFPGWNNITVVWTLEHITDNSIVLSTTFTLTLKWEVYDTTPPILEITSPTYYGETIPNQPTICFYVNVTDPDGASGYVSGGLDTTSVKIWIDGTSYNMIQEVGSVFYYDWTPLDTTDGLEYNITFTAWDNALLEGSIYRNTIIDVVNPSATINSPNTYDNGYVEVPSNGIVIISGTITDVDSTTGQNSGINSSSVFITIGSLNERVINVYNDSSFEFEWIIILDANDIDLLRRDNRFTSYEEWDMVLTFQDNAGNIGTQTLPVRLDNERPTLEITNIDQLPTRIDDELVIDVQFNDSISGIETDTLRFVLVFNDTQAVVLTFGVNDQEHVVLNSNSATLILKRSDFSDNGLEYGDYIIRVSILDNTGNKKVIETDIFAYRRPGVQINFFAIIFGAPVALVLGTGLAVLYERYKATRSI
ncbi:MAG: hypothetical protein ACFE9L_00915 [Candidatus Hodarchaeota archaeon]